MVEVVEGVVVAIMDSVVVGAVESVMVEIVDSVVVSRRLGAWPYSGMFISQLSKY